VKGDTPDGSLAAGSIPGRRYLTALAAAAVVSFAAVWAWIVLAPMAWMDPEYAAWRAKDELLRRCDLGDVLILGDSRAAADIIPALLPVNASNLAVGGGKPIEAYSALVRALTCPVPPSNVVISFDPGHFMKPDLFWERTVRFGFLDRAELADLEAISRARNDWSVWRPWHPDGLANWLRPVLYRVRFPTLYFNSLARGGLFLRWWRNSDLLDRTIAARGHYHFGTAPGSAEVSDDARFERFLPLPVLDQYFDHMLALLAARGIPARFIAMPVNDATWARVHPALRDGFSAYLADYGRRYPGFRLHGEIMPHWPNALFGDAFSHLNPEGARLLSQRLGASSLGASSLGASSLGASSLGASSLGASSLGATLKDDQPLLQAAPPSTQNDAQYGWFNGTAPDASANVPPSSKRGS
jgi:hypothetical protein